MTKVYRTDVNEGFEPSLELQRLTIEADRARERADALEAALPGKLAANQAEYEASLRKDKRPDEKMRQDANEAWRKPLGVTRDDATSAANEDLPRKDGRSSTPLERAAVAWKKPSTWSK